MLEQVVQGGCGCPILEVFQCQVGWGLGYLDLVLDLAVDNPACGRGVGAW